MRKLLLGTASVSGTVLTVAMSGLLFSAELMTPSDAHADKISIAVSTTNSASPPTVATGSGSASYTSSAVAGFSRVKVTALGTPPLSEPTLETGTIDAQSTGGTKLYVWVSEQGLTTPISQLLVGFTANDFAGDATSVSEEALVSTANDLYGDSVIASQTFTSNGSTSETVPAVAGPGLYSETTEYVLSFAGTASGVQNDTINLQQVVPEPASLALLGTALVGIGAIRRRRRRA